MDTTTCASELGDLIAREIALAENLAAALAAEHEALMGKDLAALEAAVAEKRRRAEQMSGAGKLREALIERAGFPPDRDGMAGCLEWCDPDGELQAAWLKLLARAGECRDQNQVNGGILELGRSFTQKALAILRGGQQPGDELYGPGGQTSTFAQSRTLNTA